MYIEALLHSASDHQWSRKAHQAGGQNMQQVDELIWGQVAQTIFWNLKGTITITTVTSRALMEGINMEKSSQGCYKAMQLSQ